MRRTTKTILVPTLLALGLAGCASRSHLGDDFGAVVRQNVMAQIADPDARYPQEVISDGARVGLAMERYRTGTTIPPTDLSTSAIAVTPGAGSGGGGASPK
jgi:type IV pilus biogenesis protein CpaD/CtpE